MSTVPRTSVQCIRRPGDDNDYAFFARQIKKTHGDDAVRIVVEALVNRIISQCQAKPVDALLTRREAARYVNDDLGHPLSFSTLTKLCAVGEGPPVARW
jgi:hypothetical protein